MKGRERERGECGLIFATMLKEKSDRTTATHYCSQMSGGKGKRGRQVREEQDADCSELSLEGKRGRRANLYNNAQRKVRGEKDADCCCRQISEKDKRTNVP